MVYKATIDWYSDLDNKTLKRGMFLVADSWSDAMNNLVYLYGEDEMEKITLEPFEGGRGLVFNLDDPGQRELFSMVSDILGEEVIW